MADFSPQEVQAEIRILEFQEDFFNRTAEDTLEALAIDPNRTDEISDALILANGKFLRDNNLEYLQLQSMYEKGLASQAHTLETRLRSKYKSALLKELQKLSVAEVLDLSWKNLTGRLN